MADRAENLRLTIEGCRRLVSHVREVEALRRLLDTAQVELAEIERQRRQQERTPCRTRVDC
jgi:hypothetical protein